jgi:hypothetical protein
VFQLAVWITHTGVALSHQILIAFFSLKIKFKEDAKINVLRDGDILNRKEIIKFSGDRNKIVLFFKGINENRQNH